MSMRVTDRISSRQYLHNNNEALSNMLKIENKILTQKAFTRASEDSVNANRAMKIRKNLANLDMYDTNLNYASELFTAAETNLYNIADNVYLDVNSKLVSVQDTKNQEELDAIALELEQYANEMMTCMNADFGNRQMFAGTSNNKEPFTAVYYAIDENGEFTLDENGNRQVMPEGQRTASNSRAVVFYNDTEINSSTDYTTFNGAGGIYVDVGLGIEYDANGIVDPDTAMDVGLNGAQLTGCGMDNGNPPDSNNIIQLTYDAAFALYQGDKEMANRLIDKLQKAQVTVLSGITKIGTKQSDIKFYLEKNDGYRYNLQEDQNKTEGCDLTKEITNFSSAKAAYNAALQMGSQAIPKSIFDFI